MMAESTPSDTVTLFEKEHCELMYRIPALIHIQDPPTYLAFAEMRHSLDDTDALYLVMRRGVEIDGSIQWEPIKHLRKAKQCGYRSMNPCPVYDSTTRTIFLFFVCVRSDCSERYQILLGRNAAKLCYVTSTDEGKTWSLLTKVTNEVLGDDLKKCATLAVGPGHGIQTSSGRLIIPAYLYYMHACVCKLPIPWKTKPHSFIFYSDDHGRSWHKGSMIWKERTGECEVAEMICGNSKSLLYCSARTEKHYRVEAVSSNPCMDFANPHYCNDLCEPPHGCQGSVVSFIPPMEIQEVYNNDANAESRKSDLEKGTVSWLIYSHPTSRKERVDLGIYLNKAPLEPSGWKKPWIINKGPSGYSDLVVCKDSKTFGCLFECGIHSCEKINFRRFTLGELLENLPKH